MSIAPGTYKIINVESNASVRTYKTGDTIYSSNTREFPGPFELWQIEVVTAGYTILNVGLQAFCTADAAQGNPVYTSSEATTFEISNADEESYVIKIANQDLLWTVSPPVVPRGDIILQGSEGESTQKFKLINVSE